MTEGGPGDKPARVDDTGSFARLSPGQLKAALVAVVLLALAGIELLK